MRSRKWMRVTACVAVLMLIPLMQGTTTGSTPDATAFGGIPFTEHLVSYDWASSIHAVDMDGDTDIDIVAGNRYGGLITWYENDPSQTFTPHPIQDSGEARSVYGIDLDGDDDTDILSGDYSGITWWENDGAQVFSPTLVTTDTFRARRLYAVDLDEDGDVDVLGAADSSTSSEPDVAWWENDGEEVFTRHILSSSFKWAKAVFAIDLDRDEDLDILAASNGGDEVAWWENDGEENFTQRSVGYLTEAYDVHAADVNGDGEIDVLGASWSGTFEGHSIVWWENDGAESFFPNYLHPSPDGANCVRAVDLDGDGDTDILGGTVGELYWYENDGNEGFSANLIDKLILAWEVDPVDLDGDGDLDVVAGSADSGRISWYEQGKPLSVVFLPVLFNDAAELTEAPVLDSIQNTDGDGNYTVSWSAVERADRYNLEEDDNPDFTSPRVRYSGAGTSRSFTGKGLGTYYYRVNAANGFGSTDWSNVESVAVTVLPPCPAEGGEWSGSTNQGYPIDFSVSSSTCRVGYLTIEYLAVCSGGFMWKTHTFESTKTISSGGDFYFDRLGDPRVDGSFSTTTRATGTWSTEFSLPGIGTCTGSGSWSATVH